MCMYVASILFAICSLYLIIDSYQLNLHIPIPNIMKKKGDRPTQAIDTERIFLYQ